MTAHPLGLRVLAALRAGSGTVKQVAKDACCSEAAAAAMLDICVRSGDATKAGARHELSEDGAAALEKHEADRGAVPLGRDL